VLGNELKEKNWLKRKLKNGERSRATGVYAGIERNWSEGLCNRGEGREPTVGSKGKDECT